MVMFIKHLKMPNPAGSLCNRVVRLSYDYLLSTDNSNKPYAFTTCLSLPLHQDSILDFSGDSMSLKCLRGTFYISTYRSINQRMYTVRLTWTPIMSNTYIKIADFQISTEFFRVDFR